MRYRRIATIGATLISIFVSLAALMYYFNQDECPVATFRCRNSTLCIPQRHWCNGLKDCPEGEDEDASECIDPHDDWSFLKKLLKSRSNSKSNEAECRSKQESTGPKHCEHRSNCEVSCSNVQGEEIPTSFSVNLAKMSFTNSSIQTLRKNYFRRYPKLTFLYLNGSGIARLEQDVFAEQRNLTWLSMPHNEIEEIRAGQLVGLMSLGTLTLNDNRIHILDLKDLENSTTLIELDLTRNSLTSSTLSLPYLPALEQLELGENHLEIITDNTFANLPSLRSLTLESNNIRSISSKAFRCMIHLKDLNLMYNKIKIIAPDLFVTLGNLSKLLLGHNPIENLSAASFKPLHLNLKSLNVQEIEIINIEKNLFSMFAKLEFAYFSKFHYCTSYAPKVKRCWPVSDGNDRLVRIYEGTVGLYFWRANYATGHNKANESLSLCTGIRNNLIGVTIEKGVSSLSHLLGKPLLRSAVWGISCVTCLGNALVLWGRFTAKDENRVLSIVIRNLAVSDMLMGLYLFIIGLEDIRFRNNYNQEASDWIASWPCTLLGMLAMTSSEVSVLILSFMSLERFILIAAPLKGHRAITPETAASAMMLLWLCGITLALIPAVHWRNSTRFYGLNGMCLPLHIDDPFLVGWQYSAFIFLGINLLGLIIIGYAYVGMFVSIWKTRHATPLSVGDSEFALRFFLIVLTDAVCWAPIIVLKIMALAEYPVAPDLHAWVVVFILPVNSAVNPLLYTFTTPKFRERLSEGWFSKLHTVVSRKNSRSASQTSNSYNGKSLTISAGAKSINNEKMSKLSNETLLINVTSKQK